MTITEKYFIECIAASGAFLRTYDFTVTKEIDAPLDERQLIDEAKNNLTLEGLARPPYAGIKFRIYR